MAALPYFDGSLRCVLGIQLELLNSQLALEHRIKEGAENLLNMGMAVRNRNISGTLIFLNLTRIILV